ncbi:hypothetical protein CAPTEDRAFT_209761 [Capitella teleta]|uniref:Alpha-macroglobulin-like TED domain-containing protein n=1 Tax=Capitella teleta TaxID=283909 RepID=R7TRI3_CAPTE|nr:hypothetical protein CAPTEDRAFT_209761 [Capitella teleta]|eukprot:ELT96249.1 hypothetical protein CAPTEDRAFT_209761 [Capitella teleta]
MWSLFAIISFASAALKVALCIQDGRLEEASDKGLDYIVHFIDDYGNFSDPFVTDDDLCFFFKLPLILSTGGKLREANLVLDYTKQQFMQLDGDFRTSHSAKTCFPYDTYYTNGHTLMEMFTASHLGNLALQTRVPRKSPWVTALTGDADARHVAEAISSYLVSIQKDDGSFPPSTLPGNSPENVYAMGMADANGILEAASDKGLNYTAQNIGDDGVYSHPSVSKDLCFYAQLPQVLFTGGKLREANLVLDYIKDNFLQPDGDFRTSQAVKACHPVFAHRYTSTNSWITLTAHAMERYDVSAPALEYLKGYFGSFTMSGLPSDGHNTTEMFTAAHLGMLALQTGEMKTAKRAAKVIMDIIEMQPDSDNIIYYKLDNGQLVTDASQTQFDFAVNRTAPFQPFMMVGYPAEFLAKIYMKTGKTKYLKKAKKIIKWLSTCDETLFSSTSSTGPVAVAAAWVAAITGDVTAKHVAETIASYMVSVQTDDGSFPNSYTMQMVDAVLSIQGLLE